MYSFDFYSAIIVIKIVIFYRSPLESERSEAQEVTVWTLWRVTKLLAITG